MQESQTRTSFKQRVIIGLIALLLLVTFVAVYALVVLQGEGSSSTRVNVDEAKVNELMAAYNDAQAAVDAEAANWSATYFDDFVGYKERVAAGLIILAGVLTVKFLIPVLTVLPIPLR